jgi:outer membrane protein
MRGEATFPFLRAALLAALLVSCLAPGVLRGQAPGDRPSGGAGAEGVGVTLTLEEAFERAARHNPAYRQVLNDIELSEPGRRAALGEFLPSVNLSAGTNQSMSRRTIAEDPFGNPIPNPDLSTSYTSGSSQGVSLGFNLFEGGARFHRLREARVREGQRLTAAESERTVLRAGVERSFFQALQQSELLELEEGMLAGRVRDLDATRRLFSLAARGRTDVLGAELAIRQQERAIQERRSEYRKAILALRALLGDDELDDFVLAPEPLCIFDPSVLDGDALVTNALGSNPRIRIQEANLDALGAARQATQAGRWPQISLNASLNRSDFGPDQSALFKVAPDRQSSGSLGLSVSLPIFQRFGPSNQRAQADVAVRNAREALRQMELEVDEGVRSRIIDLENAYESLEIEESSRELAEERLRLTQEEYRLAGKTFEELQTAVRAAADARRQALTARYAFVLARVALEETVGAPVDVPPGALREPEGR